MEPTVGEDEEEEYEESKQRGMFRTHGQGGFGLKKDSDINQGRPPR